MFWKTPKHGDKRTVRRFLFSPTESQDGNTYWLCMADITYWYYKDTNLIRLNQDGWYVKDVTPVRARAH